MAAFRFDTEHDYRRFVEAYNAREKRPKQPQEGQDLCRGGVKPADPAVRLLRAIIAEKLPGVWYREFTFHETRGWRIDVASPWGGYDERRGRYDRGGQTPGRWDMNGGGGYGVEIDGGVHRIKDKWVRDIAKHNALVIGGWRIVRCTPAQVDNGEALTLVKALIQELRP